MMHLGTGNALLVPSNVLNKSYMQPLVMPGSDVLLENDLEENRPSSCSRLTLWCPAMLKKPFESLIVFKDIVF